MWNPLRSQKEREKMSKFSRARRTMSKALSSDAGLMCCYQSNVAMLLHDRYGITDIGARNNAARDILGLIFSIPPEKPKG